MFLEQLLVRRDDRFGFRVESEKHRFDLGRKREAVVMKAAIHDELHGRPGVVTQRVTFNPHHVGRVDIQVRQQPAYRDGLDVVAHIDGAPLGVVPVSKFQVSEFLGLHKFWFKGREWSGWQKVGVALYHGRFGEPASISPPPIYPAAVTSP
ncbi:hypothetical protein D3C71_1709100 [compost metagenome]